jgi:hypothetical protein
MPGFCEDQARELAETGAAAARRFAPVGREVDEDGNDQGESGELRKSITADPVRRRGRIYLAGFTAHVSYASYVNDGTRAHIIRARNKRALRFFTIGKEILRASVNHPGFRGAHFMELAVAEAEREWQQRADADLQILISEVFT